MAVQVNIKTAKISSTCKHFGDFSINCVWSFFATSHGKSPCDGLGGTIKRLTARASLQRPIKNQILTAMEVLEYCQKEVQGIISIYISKETVVELRKQMVERYQYAKTVPGTRSYHQFIPLSNTKLAVKTVSEENDYSFTFNFECNTTALQIKIAGFVSCIYDGQPWIGVVEEIDSVNKDVSR